MTSEPSPPARPADLLERLAAAPELGAAVEVLCRHACAAHAGARCLLLAADGDELRAAGGSGWPADVVRSARAEPGGAAAGVAASGEPASVRGGAGPLGLRDYDAVPMPGPAGSVWGVLLVEPADPDASPPLDALAADARRAGPLLLRLRELDRLRRRVDETDRRRRLLRALADAVPDPVVVTDARGDVLLENRRAATLLSSTAADAGPRRRAAELNQLALSSHLADRLGEGGRGDGERREVGLVDPVEGADLLFEVLRTPVAAEVAGEPAVLWVLRDVGDLRQADVELGRQLRLLREAEAGTRRERDWLTTIVEHVGDPIVVTDAEGWIVRTNGRADRLLDPRPDGAGREEADRNRARFLALVSELVLSPDRALTVEVELHDPAGGAAFPAEIVAVKAPDERGATTAVVAVVHDRTRTAENERMAAELSRLNATLEERIASATEELEERNRRLEWQSRELTRAYRLKSEFLASMSHELRTPINAILGYVSLMSDRIYGDLNDRQAEALSRVRTASEHLLELVSDILDLSKIEAGKMPVSIETVELEPLIRELSRTVEPILRDKPVEYRVDVDAELPALRTDRTKVKQVVLNLLSNAAKFTHRGRVELAARALPDDGGVEIRVADTGIGIDAGDLPHIFDDFRQVDQSATREYGGTGLGLSIVRKLLGLLGGTIHVESERGEGSVFTVTLPLEGRPIPEGDEVARVARQAEDSVVKP